MRQAQSAQRGHDDQRLRGPRASRLRRRRQVGGAAPDVLATALPNEGNPPRASFPGTPRQGWVATP
jgi:hypothetical protein